MIWIIMFSLHLSRFHKLCGIGCFAYNATIVTPEEPGGDMVSIAVVGDVIPPNVTVLPNTTITYYFISAFRFSSTLLFTRSYHFDSRKILI